MKMYFSLIKKYFILQIIFCGYCVQANAIDLFSIVVVDTISNEAGSAIAGCINMKKYSSLADLMTVYQSNKGIASLNGSLVEQQDRLKKAKNILAKNKGLNAKIFNNLMLENDQNSHARQNFIVTFGANKSTSYIYDPSPYASGITGKSHDGRYIYVIGGSNHHKKVFMDMERGFNELNTNILVNKLKAALRNIALDNKISSDDKLWCTIKYGVSSTAASIRVYDNKGKIKNKIDYNSKIIEKTKFFVGVTSSKLAIQGDDAAKMISKKY